MMAVTPESLPRHELNGLRVRVVEATNPDLVGIAGRVVVETTNTLHVEERAAGSSTVRQVPKREATFEFTLEDSSPEASGPRTTHAESTDDSDCVVVEGSRLEARPARRTERTGDPKWR